MLAAIVLGKMEYWSDGVLGSCARDDPPQYSNTPMLQRLPFEDEHENEDEDEDEQRPTPLVQNVSPFQPHWLAGTSVKFR